MKYYLYSRDSSGSLFIGIDGGVKIIYIYNKIPVTNKSKQHSFNYILDIAKKQKYMIYYNHYSSETKCEYHIRIDPENKESINNFYLTEITEICKNILQI